MSELVISGVSSALGTEFNSNNVISENSGATAALALGVVAVTVLTVAGIAHLTSSESSSARRSIRAPGVVIEEANLFGTYRSVVYTVSFVAINIITLLGLIGAMPLAAVLPLLLLVPIVAVVAAETNFFSDSRNVRAVIDLVSVILITAREHVNNIVVVDNSVVNNNTHIDNSHVDNSKKVNIEGNNNRVEIN